MTTPQIEPRALEKPAAWEYALRFLFGGLVCAATGWLGTTYGVVIGGLCLAFPSILPASLTLVKRHDGRRLATDDARGAQLGAVGLLAFALVVAATATRWPAPLVLGAATLAWLGVSAGLWWIVLH